MREQDATAQEVTIIGAGIVGICSALWLQRAGYRVTVIDREGPGSGTSFGNTAMISPGQVVPYAMPGLLRDVPRWLVSRTGPLKISPTYLPTIAPWLWTWSRAGRVENAIGVSRAMRALHQNAFPLYADLTKGTPAAGFFEKCGHLHLALSGTTSRSPQLSSLMRDAAGVEAEHVSQDDIRSLEPNLAPIFKSGMMLPGNGRCRNSFRLVNFLAEEAVRLGARIARADVTRIDIQDGRCTALHINGQATPIQTLVVAAGIGSKLLTDQLGMRIPLESERGYHVTVKDPGFRPACQLVVRDWGIGVGPIDDDLRAAGTVEFSGLKAEPDWKRADRLLARLKEMFPQMDAAERTRWKGDRPSISDGLAVIGRPKRFRNIFFAFGNGQHGMTGAPMTGKVLAEMVSGQALSIDAAPFDPDRFQRRSAA